MYQGTGSRLKLVAMDDVPWYIKGAVPLLMLWTTPVFCPYGDASVGVLNGEDHWNNKCCVSKMNILKFYNIAYKTN